MTLEQATRTIRTMALLRGGDRFEYVATKSLLDEDVQQFLEENPVGQQKPFVFIPSQNAGFWVMWLDNEDAIRAVALEILNGARSPGFFYRIDSSSWADTLSIEIGEIF